MSDYDDNYDDDYDSVNEDEIEDEIEKNEIYIEDNKINEDDKYEIEDSEFIKDSIIFNSENINTTKYLTLYEKTGVIGKRAEELCNQYKKSNFSPLVDIDENMINEYGELDFIKIAEKELNDKKIPYYIKRLLQNKHVVIDINNLILREKY
jgi:DNA-directed RNA polymerase subunit K/omega